MQVNFIPHSIKTKIDVSERVSNKAHCRSISERFSYDYFDGDRCYGYGGYHYDGRWVSIAKSFIDFYDLKSGNRVLDVGCAKGYLVKDLIDQCPGLHVFGVDISDYAIQNCHIDVKNFLEVSNATSLPFDDSSFDLVISINTLHNLERADCIKALSEIARVSSRNAFVQVDAFRSDAERKDFEDWMLTAKTYLKPDDWLNVFKEAGYKGDYDWTILEYK